MIGKSVVLVIHHFYLEIQQSPIRLTYADSQANTSYLFFKFSPMPGKVSWLNTTIYIKATTLFGQIYSKAVND
jgi:hypothetical protein